jgi:opacity protein-like surface antigen
LADDIDSTAPTGVGFSTEYDTGLAATAAIGRYFGSSVRGELELSWRQADSKDIASFGASTGLDSQLKTTAVMANLLYDVRFGAPIVPYLGLGLGGAFIESDDIEDAFGNVAEGKDSTEFAWQAIAGVAWELGRFALTADYRYFGTGDDDVASQTFLAGLRLNL